MKSVFRPRWLSICAIVALSFASIRLAAGWLLPGAHERLVQQYWATVRALPEENAARFVVRLAEKDAEWAEVIITATADDRPLVASTAERELRSLVLRLARMPAEENSPHLAILARALATTFPNLPPDRRGTATSITHELITWPLDGRTIDAAQFIADCEAVLLLPLAEPIEIRVAAAPPDPHETIAPRPALDLAPTESPIQPPPVVLTNEPTPPATALTTELTPPAVLPTPPSPPTAVAPPSSNEPQRFVPGRSIRISDD